MSEEKHILTKLETIYFGKKENEKLTMHEIGILLDYVALLEQNNRYKNEEIERLNSIIKEIREYKNNLLFDLNRGKEFEKWEEILNPIDGILDKENKDGRI